VWVLGQRVHHGATGCALAVLCARRHRRLAVAALALVLHDRADWRAWFRRERVPAGELVSALTSALDPELSKG
jgi:hypothetical protein